MGNTPAMISKQTSHSLGKGDARVKEFVFDPGQPLPLVFEAMGASTRQAEWGDFNVAIEHMPAGTDTALRNLPRGMART